MSHSLEWADMEEEEEDHDDGSMSLMISSSSTTNSSLSLPPPPSHVHPSPPPPSSQGEGADAIVGGGLSSSSPCLLPSSSSSHLPPLHSSPLPPPPPPPPLLPPPPSSSPSQPNFQYLPLPRRLEPSSVAVASHMRRKKWTEEEEDTLITKYRELLCSGALAKLKTRARKFQPIADHVNALHHGRDPAVFPWEWTWRDVSIKVQNMRHQYIGVKQKIRRCFVTVDTPLAAPPGRDREDEYDWDEGVNHWPNFLKYKEVFGDVELFEPNLDTPSPFPPPRFSLSRGANPLSVSVSRPIIINNRPWGGGESKQSVAGDDIGTIMPNGGELGLAITAELGGGSIAPPPSMEPPPAPPTAPHSHGVSDAFCIDYDGIDEHDGLAETGDEDAEKEAPHPYAKRRKLSRSSRGDCILFNYLVNQFAEFRNRELQRQERERSKDREQEERDLLRNEAESDIERQREAFLRQAEQSRKQSEHEREKREQAREERARQFQHKLLEMWEEDRMWRRKSEERREKETMDWMERMMRLEMEHQASIMQVHARLAQNQQTAINLLMALVLSLGVENPRGHGGFASPVVSQLLQNIQQSREDIIQEVDKRSNGGGDNDSFLVNE